MEFRFLNVQPDCITNLWDAIGKSFRIKDVKQKKTPGFS